MTMHLRSAETRGAALKQARRGSVPTGRSGTVILLFLLPALALIVLLRLVPTVGSLSAAFETRDGGLGLETFAYLFQDPQFLGSLKVTLLFSLIVNPLQIGLALALAVLLTRGLRGERTWQALILLPAVVPQSVSAIIWATFMRPDGPLNAFAREMGFPAVPWLTSPDYALTSVIIVCSWVGVGFWMTFLITGIRDIPTSHYEASFIDGANAWQRFIYITLPGLRRPLLFVLVADTVSNLLVFAPVRLLTRGGPEGSTNLAMHYIFETGYALGDTALASAATIILVGIVVVVTAVQFALLPGRGQ
jgi:multiple sugar transport system permease protein